LQKVRMKELKCKGNKPISYQELIESETLLSLSFDLSNGRPIYTEFATFRILKVKIQTILINLQLTLVDVQRQVL
jgi:hypothetical protein